MRIGAGRRGEFVDVDVYGVLSIYTNGDLAKPRRCRSGEMVICAVVGAEVSRRLVAGAGRLGARSAALGRIAAKPWISQPKIAG